MSKKPKLTKFIDRESGLTAYATDIDFAFELLSVKCDMLGFAHPLINNIKPFKNDPNDQHKSKSIPEIPE